MVVWSTRGAEPRNRHFRMHVCASVVIMEAAVVPVTMLMLLVMVIVMVMVVRGEYVVWCCVQRAVH